MKRLLLALLVFVPGCPSPVPPPGGTDCVAACQRLHDLKCTDLETTPNGAPCTDWLCGAHGAKSACIARATSCADAKDKQEHGCP